MKMWIFYFQIIAIALTSSYAADAHCKYYFIGSVQCNFDYVSNVTAPNEEITVEGQIGFVDTYSRYLNMDERNQFSYFPTKLLTIFPNTVGVYAGNNSMTTLVTNAIDNCQALESVTIGRQLFTNVPAGIAQNCVKLQNLLLDQNQISTIDKDALKGLSKLTYFNAGNNKITCIPSGLFVYSPLLETITLNDNFITALDPISFKGLPNLAQILLSSNKIQYLPNFDMTGSATNPTVNSYKSFTFDFEENPITAIDPQFIPTLYSSRLLYKIYIKLGNTNQSTCIPMYMPYIETATYTSVNSSLTTCYNNWNPSFNQPVACPPITTTTTTTITTTVATQTTTAAATTTQTTTATTSSPTACVQPAAPTCCSPPQGILNLMLTKIMNMTLSVSFP